MIADTSEPRALKALCVKTDVGRKVLLMGAFYAVARYKGKKIGVTVLLNELFSINNTNVSYA